MLMHSAILTSLAQWILTTVNTAPLKSSSTVKPTVTATNTILLAVLAARAVIFVQVLCVWTVFAAVSDADKNI